MSTVEYIMNINKCRLDLLAGIKYAKQFNHCYSCCFCLHSPECSIKKTEKKKQKKKTLLCLTDESGKHHINLLYVALYADRLAQHC